MAAAPALNARTETSASASARIKRDKEEARIKSEHDKKG